MLTIVLLPGMDGTGELFAPFIAALGDEIAVCRVSYSTSDPAGYDRLLAVARAALPERGGYILLGESFSGPLAVTIAAERPKGLVGLILCSTFVRNPRPAFRPFGFLAQLAPVKLAPDFVLSYLLLGRFAQAALLAALKAAISRVSGRVLRARMRAVMTVDVSSALLAIQMPVLYLRAAQDKLVPAAVGDEIAAVNPETRLMTIDAPHCLLQAAPVVAAQAVLAFTRECIDRQAALP